MTQKFTLKREEKLKSRKLIQKLFKEGKSFSEFPFRILFLENEKEGEVLQAAFSVSKRHFKQAVKRNRIKRLMRESYRLRKPRFKTFLFENDKRLSVFFIYTASEMPSFSEIFEKTTKVLERIEKLLSTR
ncbi:MAG: ribonuclease P protein component [Ginsengibacter sp.]